MIEEGTPVVVFDNTGDLNEKTALNVAEVAARGAHILRVGASGDSGLRIPPVGSVPASFTYAVVAQLLAYFVSVERGTDVDQPRNLAKSVTVE